MVSGCFASELGGERISALGFPTSVLQHTPVFLYVFSRLFLKASLGLFRIDEQKHEITTPQKIKVGI